jgi:hypothetical protein
MTAMNSDSSPEADGRMTPRDRPAGGGLRDDHAVHVRGGRAVLASARLPDQVHPWPGGGLMV